MTAVTFLPLDNHLYLRYNKLAARREEDFLCTRSGHKKADSSTPRAYSAVRKLADLTRLARRSTVPATPGLFSRLHESNMRRRRQLPPDTRYHWDDPELPALMLGIENATGRPIMVWVPPKLAQETYKKRFNDLGPPRWDKDPSYNWAKHKLPKAPLKR